MKLSINDKNFIQGFINHFGQHNLKSCKTYNDAVSRAEKSADKFISRLSLEQLNFYQIVRENNDELKTITNNYYFIMGLKTFYNIYNTIDNPVEIIDELLG